MVKSNSILPLLNVLVFKLFTGHRADNMVIEAMRKGLKGE